MGGLSDPPVIRTVQSPWIRLHLEGRPGSGRGSAFALMSLIILEYIMCPVGSVWFPSSSGCLTTGPQWRARCQSCFTRIDLQLYSLWETKEIHRIFSPFNIETRPLCCLLGNRRHPSTSHEAMSRWPLRSLLAMSRLRNYLCQRR